MTPTTCYLFFLTIIILYADSYHQIIQWNIVLLTAPYSTKKVKINQSMYRNEMNLFRKKDAQDAPFIKLLAHILGIGACSSFSFFVFGMGIPDFLKPRTNGFVTFSLFLLIPMIGYIITWFHERTGALIMLAGAMVLMIYHFYYGDISMGFVFGLPFFVCAFLFLWHTKFTAR